MADKLQQDIPNTARVAASPPAVLLPYQQSWIADDSPLKVYEKSRRIGISWAEGSDDALIAASEGIAGGQNVYYIGYNQDMAIEFIEACAMWCRAFNYAASEIEEGLWDDGDDDKHIKTYTIKLPQAAHRIVALSSRPANLRGKQGIVIIDEAAFHDQLDELLKAAIALLIWGGKVRIISTHNGEDNPFNELIQEIRAGKRKGKVHRTTFREAVQQGLYRRVCLRLGKVWTQADEDAWVTEVYDFYGEDAAEELDVIPATGGGRYLTRALVESVSNENIPIIRLSLDDAFTLQPEHIRVAEIDSWCEQHLKPHLDSLNPNYKSHFGEDFARSGDATCIWPVQEQPDLFLKTPFLCELRNVPFEQQKQVLFYIVRGLPRFRSGAMDARGNGQYLAEVAQQEFGAERIAQVMLTQEWYRMNMPRFKASFEDRTSDVPKHADVMADMLAVKMDKGIAKVPDDARVKGADGKYRHGDSAIAKALMHYAVSEVEGYEIEYTRVRHKSSEWDEDMSDDDDVKYSGAGTW